MMRLDSDLGEALTLASNGQLEKVGSRFRQPAAEVEGGVDCIDCIMFCDLLQCCSHFLKLHLIS